MTHKRENDKLDFIKLQNSHLAKDPIKRIKRETTGKEKYLQTAYMTEA